jgi:two-component system, NarL family, response regulator FusR
MHCLVVDDDYLPRGGTIKTLQSLRPDAVVSEAESLAQAFDVLSRSPKVELVVLDLNLAESNGVQTLKTLREWCDKKELSPRIVVLSGAGEDNPALVIEILDNYGTGFIPKKGTPEQIFRSALALTLAGGIFIPVEILRQLRLTPETAPAVKFTPREREVAALLVRGWTYKRIANELSKRQHSTISEHTVRSHVGNMAWKLGIDDSLPAKAGVMAQLATLKIEFPEL